MSAGMVTQRWEIERDRQGDDAGSEALVGLARGGAVLSLRGLFCLCLSALRGGEAVHRPVAWTAGRQPPRLLLTEGVGKACARLPLPTKDEQRARCSFFFVSGLVVVKLDDIRASSLFRVVDVCDEAAADGDGGGLCLRYTFGNAC